MTDAALNSISPRSNDVTSRRLMIAVSVLIALSLTSATKTHAQCTRCCFPYANLSISPTTAEEGQPVAVTTLVTNCLPYARVLTVRVNVTPNNTACSSFAEAFSMSVYVPRLQARSVTYTFAAPKCDGTYKVSASNGAGTATKTLTVN